MRILQEQRENLVNNGDYKKDKELRAMAFSDGSIVLHNVQDGFKVEMFDSVMGKAEPIELSKLEMKRLRTEDLKKIKFEDGVIKERGKNDSKDVSSPVQEVQGQK